jgi:two-component system phosphate regulon sensor histidine kinase PhoR
MKLQLDNFNKAANISLAEILNRINLNEEIQIYTAAAKSFNPYFEVSESELNKENNKIKRDKDLIKLKKFLSLHENTEFLEYYNGEIFNHYEKVTSSTSENVTKEKLLLEKLLSDTSMLRNSGFVSELKKQYRVRAGIPISLRINPIELDSVIRKVFKTNDVNGEYSYKIIQSPTDSILESFSNKANIGDNAIFAGRLFTNGQVVKEYYLVFEFDGQYFKLFQNLGAILAISLATIIMLGVGFTYTVKTIFEQKRLAEMKTDFINNMTHELKTPIATITLASEALLDLTENPQFKFISRYSQTILTENERMRNNVDRILNTALLESRDFKLEKHQLDAHYVINKILLQLDLRLKSRLAKVNVSLNASNPIIVADETHLANVINNLLDNAIKYSNNELVIDIETVNLDEGLLIRISDNGIGMSIHEQKRAFEKFFRANTGDVHNVKGFGLGLSYVKSIVDAHKGYINLSSEIGKGTRFEIYFPYNSNTNNYEPI